MRKSIGFLVFLCCALAGSASVFGGSATEAGKQAAGQAAQQVVTQPAEQAATSAGQAASQLPAAQPPKININSADLTQLDSLPGIGPETAKKIVEYRQEKGGFKSVEELKEVKGIGDKKYDALKDLVTIK